MLRLVATLAVELRISPREVEALDHDELVTLVDVLNERARKAKR